jgi:very-short-patch-repair endonuclease/YHS domain-containing protein
LGIITCRWCGKQAKKPKKEINRWKRMGRNYFFCSLKCSAKYNASLTKNKVIQKYCPVCGNKFKTNDGAKSATFCSRGCASRGSVTKYRRQKAIESGKKNSSNLISIEETLRKREFWKYKSLGQFLEKQYCGDHEFEFRFPNTKYICDLALKDDQIIVEFDGREHSFSSQKKIDEERDTFIEKMGWDVVRIPVRQKSKINVSLLLRNSTIKGAFYG